MGHIKRIIEETGNNIRKVSAKWTFLHGLGIGFWVLLTLIFVIGIFFISNIEAFISLIISDYSYLGIFITSVITDMLVQPVGPDVPLVLGTISGIFKPWIVFGVVLAGSYLALLFTYYIGKSVGAAGIEKIVGKKSYAKIDKYKLQGKWFMFIGALTPVPYIPYLAGLWRFNLRDTILYVVIPRTIRFLIVFLLVLYMGIRLV